MDASASVLDELDGPRVLHAFGALAVDLQDFISDLEGEAQGHKDGVGGERKQEKKRGRVTGEVGRRQRKTKQNKRKQQREETNGRTEGQRREAGRYGET